jgi:hypothetical protein
MTRVWFFACVWRCGFLTIGADGVRWRCACGVRERWAIAADSGFGMGFAARGRVSSWGKVVCRRCDSGSAGLRIECWKELEVRLEWANQRRWGLLYRFDLNSYGYASRSREMK